MQLSMISLSPPSCLYMRVCALVGAFFYAGEEGRRRCCCCHRGAPEQQGRPRGDGRDRLLERAERQPAAGGREGYFPPWCSFWIGSLALKCCVSEQDWGGLEGGRRATGLAGAGPDRGGRVINQSSGERRLRSRRPPARNHSAGANHGRVLLGQSPVHARIFVHVRIRLLYWQRQFMYECMDSVWPVIVHGGSIDVARPLPLRWGNKKKLY